jgi:putative glycosyltransferase (TIGR04372 family)
MLYSLAYARRIGMPVCFLWPDKVANEALLEVDAEDVQILVSRGERLLPIALGTAAARLAALRGWGQLVTSTARAEAVSELGRRLRGPREISPVARSLIKEQRGSLKGKRRSAAQGKQARTPDPPVTYNRRRLLVDPVATKLRGDAERRGQELAAGFGLDASSRLVCLHVRERGYKLGAEAQDKGSHAWDDSVRNARIETHMPAVDHLVDRGYTVVRIGDSTMTPVMRDGLIDLATSPAKDKLLELWCLFQSRFIMCGESGPLSVSYLTNTPLLTVNATDPVGTFPTRPDGIFLLKTIIDRATGAPLSPSKLLTEEHLRDLRNPERHQFVENTPTQIVEAVEEMLHLLDRRPPESAGQAWYRELVTEAASRFTHLQYVRKHGSDRGYMGYGRLARSLADRWFEAEVGSRPMATVPR